MLLVVDADEIIRGKNAAGVTKGIWSIADQNSLGVIERLWHVCSPYKTIWVKDGDGLKVKECIIGLQCFVGIGESLLVITDDQVSPSQDAGAASSRHPVLGRLGNLGQEGKGIGEVGQDQFIALL